ncbi:MAG: hypothetical protein CMP23_17700 [Rickettsiales bacterium]|nr:hypothetical protein [Rickettsiales bacterium]
MSCSLRSRVLPCGAAALLWLLPGAAEAVQPEHASIALEQAHAQRPGGSTAAVKAGVDESSFAGIGLRFPLRLRLAYGGLLEGALGGLDRHASELLLIRPQRSLRVHFKLIASVESLVPLLPADENGRLPPAPSVARSDALELKWRPTWRSHLGAVMSFVVPGTGQFLHRDERALGVLFLVSDLFFVGAGLLAFFGPSELNSSQRRGVGGTFLGLALTTSVLSSVHAFQAGREVRGGS